MLRASHEHPAPATQRWAEWDGGIFAFLETRWLLSRRNANTHQQTILKQENTARLHLWCWDDSDGEPDPPYDSDILLKYRFLPLYFNWIESNSHKTTNGCNKKNHSYDWQGAGWSYVSPSHDSKFNKCINGPHLCSITRHPLHVFICCLGVWGSFLWHWAPLLQGEGWQPDGRPRRPVCWVLVCVCCHSNRQAANGRGMAEVVVVTVVVVAPAWFMDSEGGRAERMFGRVQKKKKKKKPRRGSIWWICKGSGRALSHSEPPTMYRHEQDWCFSCFSTAGALPKD